MRELGNAIDMDPLDFSRDTIAEHAERAAWYADMLHKLAMMRDDDGAAVMARRLSGEMTAIKIGFTALGEMRLASANGASPSAAGDHPPPDRNQ